MSEVEYIKNIKTTKRECEILSTKYRLLLESFLPFLHQEYDKYTNTNLKKYIDELEKLWLGLGTGTIEIIEYTDKWGKL